MSPSLQYFALVALLLLVAHVASTSGMEAKADAGAAAEEVVPPPPGMVVGSVSQRLEYGKDGSAYLIFLPPHWKADAKAAYPVMLFLHGVGGIRNANGCRNPGLTTQFPLLDPAYAAVVEHIVLVPVAEQEDWRHHLDKSMELVHMAVIDLGGDPYRVSVAGQAMGGHGALLYASLRPTVFSAVVVICGFLDDTVGDRWKMTTSGDVAYVPATVGYALRNKPVWIFHSEEDDAKPDPLRKRFGASIADSKALEVALKSNGNDNGEVKFTTYPMGSLPPNYITGHAAFEYAFHDKELFPWLARKRLKTRGPTLPEHEEL